MLTPNGSEERRTGVLTSRASRDKNPRWSVHTLENVDFFKHIILIKHNISITGEFSNLVQC